MFTLTISFKMRACLLLLLPVEFCVAKPWNGNPTVEGGGGGERAAAAATSLDNLLCSLKRRIDQCNDLKVTRPPPDNYTCNLTSPGVICYTADLHIERSWFARCRCDNGAVETTDACFLVISSSVFVHSFN